MIRGLTLIATAAVTLLAAASSGAATGGTEQTYLVLLEQGASQVDAQTAVERAGGRITSEYRRIGLATVRSSNEGFAADVAASGAVYGAARDEPIGDAPPRAVRDPFAIERERRPTYR